MLTDAVGTCSDLEPALVLTKVTSLVKKKSFPAHLLLQPMFFLVWRESILDCTELYAVEFDVSSPPPSRFETPFDLCSLEDPYVGGFAFLFCIT